MNTEDMKFSKYLVFFTVLFSCHFLLAQEKPDSKQFPSGQPILRIFSNFHSGINNENNRTAFELERAYIGYQMDVNPEFSVKLNLDIGSPDDVSEFSKIRRYAYFKNAAITYKKAFIRVDFGLIDMMHFKLQEDFWGHRYIDKSFADRYRFGPSADLGADFIFDIRSKVKIDLTFSNGEGYTNLQRDNTLKAGLGVESELFRGFFVRVYGDLMEKGVTEWTGALFAGYKFKKLFRVGAEYNWKLNEGYREGYHRQGYSVYGSCQLPYRFEIFARYDFVGSAIPEDEDKPWDLVRDGSSLIGGVQYMPIDRLKLALSYRDWYPYAKNLENLAFIYLYLEFKY